MQNEKSNKIMEYFEEKFMPVAAKLGSQRHLLALRDGVVMMMPLLILGAFSMIVAEFPVQGFLDFMAKTFGENWNAFEGVIMNATYGIAAVVIIEPAVVISDYEELTGIRIRLSVGDRCSDSVNSSLF